MDSDERYKRFSIELDCAPGTPRPADLIQGVLAGTGLETKDFDTANPFFGHQTWVLRAEAGKDETFQAVKEKVIRKRVESLYFRGVIRYGSW